MRRGKTPRATAVGLALLGVALVGFGDEATGAEVAFTLLYLGPVAFATWLAGRRAGILVSGVSAAVWLVADLISGPAYRHPAVRYWNLAVEVGVFLTFSLILASLKEHLDSEHALARTDPLTGAANRRAFDESASRELERARRYSHPLTLAYIDVDGFKAVNDRLGHAQGDALLAAVSSTLTRNVRAFDVVARMGGDEFAMLLPETAAAAGAALLGRLREDLRSATERGRWPVTFSIGAVTFEACPETVEEMLQRADHLMYAVKSAGKDGLRHEVVANRS